MQEVIEWAHQEPGCRRIEMVFGCEYHEVNQNKPLWAVRVYSVFENGEPRACPGFSVGYNLETATVEAFKGWIQNLRSSMGGMHS